MKYSLKEIEMLKQDREKCQRRVNRLMGKAPVNLINAYQDLMHQLDREIIKINIDNDLFKKLNIEVLRTCKE